MILFQPIFDYQPINIDIEFDNILEMGPWEMNNYVNLILCIQFIFYRPFTNVHLEKKTQLTNFDMAY